MSTPLWRLVEEWRDSQPIPPTWARVAKRLGVSQSAFDKWKNPTEMPQRRTLWAIHELTRVPFKTVVDAAIESVDLYNAERAKEAAEAHYRKHVDASKETKPVTRAEPRLVITQSDQTVAKPQTQPQSESRDQ